MYKGVYGGLLRVTGRNNVSVLKDFSHKEKLNDVWNVNNDV